MTIHATAITFHDCRIHLEPIGSEPSIAEQRYRFHVEHVAGTEAILGTAIRQWVRGNEHDMPAQKDANPEDSPDKMRQVASVLSYNDSKKEAAAKHLLLWAAGKIELLIRERDEARQMHKERVYYDRARLQQESQHLAEQLARLRIAAQAIIDKQAPYFRELVDELRKALG